MKDPKDYLKKPKPVVIDRGAYGLKEGQQVPIEFCPAFVCIDCGHKQRETWSKMKRAAMPRCQLCGGALDLPTKVKEEAKKDREIDSTDYRCKKCGCKLRRGNFDDYCSPCQNSFKL